MAQRFTAIMAGIAAAACVAGCLLLWQVVQQGRTAQEAMLAAQHELMENLLDQLARSNRGDTIDPRLAGWAAVEIRLVSSSNPTRPVQGHAKISGGPIGIDFNNQNQITKESVTDETGTIDLGTVPLGKYWLTIKSDDANASNTNEIIIGPEGYDNVVIPCPDTRPAPASLSFAFPDLPESLQGAVFLVNIGCESEQIAGRAWQRKDGYHRLLVASDGRVFGSQDGREEDYAIDYGVSTGGFPGGFGGREQRSQTDGGGQLFKIDRETEVRAHRYGVTEVRVLAPRRPEQLAEGTDLDAVRLVDFQFEWKPDFQPDLEQPSVWTIHLPPDVVRRAEASLIAFGLRPVPAGMTLVRITPESTGAYDPGTRLDVAVTYVLTGPTNAEELTRPLLQNVELFAPAMRVHRPGLPDSTEMGILVTPEQAPVIELATARAHLSLTAHADGSAEEPTTALPDPALLEELQRAQPPERRGRSRSGRPAFGGFPQ